MAVFVDKQELNLIRQRFTELGQTLGEVAHQNSEMFYDTFESMGKFGEVVSNLAKSEDFKKASQAVHANDQYVSRIASRYQNMSDKMGGSFNNLNKTVKQAEGNFEKLSNEVVELLRQEEASPAQKEGETYADKKDRAKDKKELHDLARKVHTGLRPVISAVQGVLRSLNLPTGPGTVLSTAISWMKHGYLDANRVKAEAGEIENILVATYKAGVKGSVEVATKHLSKIQETLFQYYGINRSEIQAVVKTLQAGALSVDEINRKIGRSFEIDIDRTLSTTMLALDLLFEMPGGTSAQKMTDYMSKYALTTKEAKDEVVRMYMLGKQGIGAQRFVQDVETAADSLYHLGYNIKDVTDVADFLRKAYQDMGVPRQFAGRQAAMGVQQVAQGIAQMSDDWMVLLGEKMGQGRGIVAAQAMRDSLRNALEKKDTNRFVEAMKALWEIALEMTGGDEVTAEYVLKNAFNWQGARAIAKVGKAVKEGKMVEASKVAKENMQELANSFGIEKKKTSQHELIMNSWMKGIAQVGQGLMGMAAEALAWLIAFCKMIPGFFGYLKQGEVGKAFKLAQDVNRLYGMGGGHASLMMQGIDKMLMSAEKMGQNVLGSSLKTLRSAWNFDPLKGGQQVTEPDESAGLRMPGGLWQPMQATVQPVQIPSTAGSFQAVYPASIPVTKEKQRGLEGDEDYWVGGGVNLEVSGVDVDGNIEVVLTGNCPRCGFVFGADAPYDVPTAIGSGLWGVNWTDEAHESLARMVESEIGGARAESAEGIMAMSVALNRLRWKYGGDPNKLKDVLTGGKGFGKQGSNREFSTARAPSPASLQAARKMLTGEIPIADPQAAAFFHTGERGILSGKYSGFGGTGRPKFAREGINIANLTREGTLSDPGGGTVMRVYAAPSSGRAAAPESEALDRRYEKAASTPIGFMAISTEETPTKVATGG